MFSTSYLPQLTFLENFSTEPWLHVRLCKVFWNHNEPLKNGRLNCLYCKRRWIGGGTFRSVFGEKIRLGAGNLLDNTVPLLTQESCHRILSGAVSVASGTASPFTPGQAEVRWLEFREEEDGFLAGRWRMVLYSLLSGWRDHHNTEIASWGRLTRWLNAPRLMNLGQHLGKF